MPADDTAAPEPVRARARAAADPLAARLAAAARRLADLSRGALPRPRATALAGAPAAWGPAAGRRPAPGLALRTRTTGPRKAAAAPRGGTARTRTPRKPRPPRGGGVRGLYE
ncbi:hypothetical protein ABZ579_26035, partial [Streptomyces thermolilacinus]